MESPTPQRRERQPWNEALYEYKQLRFLQYFCGFEDNPIDPNTSVIPSDFDATKTKKELFGYINELDDKVFVVVYGNSRVIPRPEILRNMLIDHFGLTEGEAPIPYKKLRTKYKVRENRIGPIFRLVLDKIKEHSTF